MACLAACSIGDEEPIYPTESINPRADCQIHPEEVYNPPALLARSLFQVTSTVYILTTFFSFPPRSQHMPLHSTPVEPRTFLQVEQSGQPVVVYQCKLQGVPCGLFVEGTTSAVSAHLRGHGITGPDNSRTHCPWESCSKILKKESMTRHILIHFGVKVRCSVCGVVKCRRDLLRAHINSSELCHFASVEMVDGPKGHVLVPTSWSATLNSDSQSSGMWNIVALILFD